MPPASAGVQQTSARQMAEQLKRFIQSSEASPSSQAATVGTGLSDTGFLLLRLKDQLLDQRGAFFATEFSSRPYNGLELLIKVVVVLQAIVNAVNNASKISNLLTRTNSSSSRKRKAAVAEADCIECIKIILEKSPSAWRAVMEHAGNLEVILYSVNSPQLDSKCYALEIILLLLDQPHGFTMLFRSLSFIAGRNRDEIRLALFVAQLKHGLHTAKLHIQILVVRLLNKLLLTAPTPAHRIMAQVDAELALFSPAYVEKGQTAVVKNVERQRYRKHAVDSHSGSGGSAAGNRTAQSMTTDRDRDREQYYPFDHAYTMTKTWDPVAGYPLARAIGDERLDKRYDTGMRRAKSESTMLFDEKAANARVVHHRPENHRPENHRRQQQQQPTLEQSSRQFSRSTHDLTRQPSNARVRPSSATMNRSPSDRNSHHRSAANLSSSSGQQVQTAVRRVLSPPPARASPRARFAEPLVERPAAAIQGFSYLFPAQPVLNSLPTKQRARTPEPPRARQTSIDPQTPPPGRPPSAPIFDRALSPPIAAYAAETRLNGEVIYIPIAVEGTNTVLRRRSTAERRPGTPGGGGHSPHTERDYAIESRSPSTYNGGTATFGDDVRDALSQFDYLNDYEVSSQRGGGGGGGGSGNNGNGRHHATATYHF